MAKKLTKAQLSAKLIEIVNAGENGMFTPADVHGPLVTDGTVEINPGNVDASGNIATRATSKGIELVNQSNAAKQTSNTNSSQEFTLENAKLPPIVGRGRAGTEKYPFDKMEVGQSFFVPNEGDGSASKSLASTVSSATKRYAEETGETKTVTVKGKDGAADTTKEVPVLRETRKFVVRSRTAAAEAAEGFNHGKDGARVYRVQ